MNIAIVDDLKEDREDLKTVLNTYLSTLDFKTTITEFSCGQDFLDYFEEGMFDICFMDIYMNDLNGMATAKVLAAKDPNCFIIFLTTSPDYLAEGYDVRAWRYILKPLTQESVAKILDPCIEKIVLSKRYLEVKVNREQVLIPFSRIVYIISESREIICHLQDGTTLPLTSCTFTHISTLLLEDYRFISCGKGITLNMHYITFIDEDMLVMTTGDRLPISRRKMKEVKTAYMQFCIAHK